jgi:hypothetical protein
MDMSWSNFVTELIGRIDGPMHFRVYLQPLVAIFFAFRDGRNDARAGRPAYGWALLTNSEHRRYLLQDGWKGFRNVFLIALLLDLVYQYLAIGAFRPLQALLTALLLAVVPYLLLRGPVNRLSGGGK